MNTKDQLLKIKALCQLIAADCISIHKQVNLNSDLNVIEAVLVDIDDQLEELREGSL